MPSLEALVASAIEVTAVVTNPDRPAGRGLQLRASPVKEAALAHGVPVEQSAKARDEAFVDWLRVEKPDVAVVVAYGKILPPELLEIPPFGFVNVHFSLLPAYRGAAPVQRAVLGGDAETGASLIVLTEGMDEGPVLARVALPIEATDTSGTVGDKLARVGAELLVPTLEGYVAGDISPEEQDHARATYAPKITNDEAEIDWSWPAAHIDRHVRALDPAPGGATELRGKVLKVWSVTPPTGPVDLRPGEIAVIGGELLVGTGDDALVMGEVQPAGKRRMSGADLARGLRPLPGERLGRAE